MLQHVKLALRIKSAAFDDEISGLIAACAADLRLAGVHIRTVRGKKPPAGDPLIERAVILYCKAHFGYYEDKNKMSFAAAYEHLKIALCLAGDYAE